MEAPMNKTSLAVIVLGLAATVSLPAVDPPVLSRWAASPAKIDGLPDEWREDAVSLEKSVGVEYAFRNDGRNLYILFIFKDPKSLSSIEATGMTLFFSGEGKKQRDFGVRFRRRPVSAEELIATMEKQGAPLTPEKKQEMRAAKMYNLYAAEAVDKKGEVVPASPSAAADAPAFHAAKQETNIIYEFRVPLVPWDIHPAGVGSGPGGDVKVGFEWGGSAMKVLSTKTSWHSPQSIVSGDVFTGSGETRAQEFLSSFDGMSRPALKTKTYSFWVDVKLAPTP